MKTRHILAIIEATIRLGGLIMAIIVGIYTFLL